MSLVNPLSSQSVRLPATVADLHALQTAISPARLKTYLRQSHFNLRRALELYEWNARAGAALYPLFQVNEIALRNAVNAALIDAFGPEWPWSGGFLRSLPAQDRARFESEKNKLQSRLGKRPSTGDVVAAQTYWFWVFLFTARFQDRIWKRGFALAFPHAPRGVDRTVVYDRCDAIRRLRNRIAHHEPLLRFDLPGAYNRALSIVRWVSPVKAQWAAERWPLGPDVRRR
jgi:hypothetical protein